MSRDRAPEDLFVLAVDLGTGGPKVGLVSLTGRIAYREHQPVATRFGPEGEATQDAGEWWRLVLGAGRRAMESGLVAPEQVVAVSCTGQWASTVPVDEAGSPVGDCLLWSDTRGGPLARQAVGGWLAGYAPTRRCGGSAGAAVRPRPRGPTRSATCSTWNADCPRSHAPPATTSSRSTTSRCASAGSRSRARHRWPRPG